MRDSQPLSCILGKTIPCACVWVTFRVNQNYFWCHWRFEVSGLFLSLCIHLVNPFVLEKITISLVSTVTCLYTYSSSFMAQDPPVLRSALFL